jgi:hypothetical protein
MYKSRPSNSSGEYGFTLAMVGILDLTIIGNNLDNTTNKIATVAS